MPSVWLSEEQEESRRRRSGPSDGYVAGRCRTRPRALTAASLVSCRAEWPDGLVTETAPPPTYVRRWREPPAPPGLAAFGDRWIAEQRSAIPFVRSVIMPSELNVIVNPGHPDAARIVHAAPEPFGHDPRVRSARTARTARTSVAASGCRGAPRREPRAPPRPGGSRP